MELPPGHRFNPFEHELITLFLKPKVLGQKLASNVVKEKQLYGPNSNPWQIFNPQTYPWILSEVSVGKFEKLAYVFVNLSKKAVKKTKSNGGGRQQFIKKAGCGTWDGQTKRTEIRDFNGDLIGERRMLVFEINEVSKQEDLSCCLGHWRMHEYNLCGVNKDIPNPANTVLCKIILDSSKTPAIKLHPNKTICPKQLTTSQKSKEGVLQKCVEAETVATHVSEVLDTDVEEGILGNCVEAVTTPSCCDVGLVSIDPFTPIGEEDCSVEIDEEWLNSVLVSEEGIFGNCVEAVTTPSCCDDGLVSIDPYRPIGEEDCSVEIDEDWLNSVLVSEEEAQGGNLLRDMTDFKCPSYPDQPVDDFTTNLGKRKLHVETSYTMIMPMFVQSRNSSLPKLGKRKLHVETSR